MLSPLPDAALDRLFRQGRSFNHYRDEPVSEADFRAVWDLMKWGPTSTNQLPARLVWVASAEGKATLADCASGSNGDKILAAPATVIVGMDLDFHENLPELFPHADAKSWFGDEEGRRVSAFRNASLQGAYLIMAARALGLDCGPMSGFDADAVDRAFFADHPRVRTNFISTIGHGDPAGLHERLPRPDFDRFNRLA